MQAGPWYNFYMPKRQSAKEGVTSPQRLEAFSDAVIAIIITIMVLGIAAPAGPTFGDWQQLLPRLAAYALSFVFIAIYWNNHHQLLRSTKRISGGVMWANMHLLFWLSLILVVTTWIGEDDHFLHASPVVAYGAVAFLAAIAYEILVRLILRIEPNDVVIRRLGRNVKGIVSLMLYALGILIATLGLPLLGIVCYVVVSLIWFIPDRRLSVSA